MAGARTLGAALEARSAPSEDAAFEAGCRRRLETYRDSLSYLPPIADGSCESWCYDHSDPWNVKCNWHGATTCHRCHPCTAWVPSESAGGVATALLRELYDRRVPGRVAEPLGGCHSSTPKQPPVPPVSPAPPMQPPPSSPSPAPPLAPPSPPWAPPPRWPRRCDGWCQGHADPWDVKCRWPTNACSSCDECPMPVVRPTQLAVVEPPSAGSLTTPLEPPFSPSRPPPPDSSPLPQPPPPSLPPPLQPILPSSSPPPPLPTPPRSRPPVLPPSPPVPTTSVLSISPRAGIVIFSLCVVISSVGLALCCRGLGAAWRQKRTRQTEQASLEMPNASKPSSDRARDTMTKVAATVTKARVGMSRHGRGRRFNRIADGDGADSDDGL